MAGNAQIARLKARFNAVPIAAREAAQASLRKSGDELADLMRSLAETSRDTGALIDSIEVTPGNMNTPPFSQPGGSTVVPENAVMVTAGNHAVRYPHLVEHGTDENDAKPFFWPAFRMLRDKIKRRTGRDIRKAIRAMGSK
ncbi:HK97 gp10 family phage protein [Devosia sp. 2618]|uniref:HK97 gp10 family phage protein n=1 Tax=Devosia sp. 2618 TaxID=3156454 RepID=UPI00339833A8